MKKQKVGIFLFDDAEVLDFAGPFEVFSVASQLHDYQLFDVFTFAESGKPVRAVNGLSVNPDYNISDLPEIDILIIPGGDGTKKLIENLAVSETLETIGKEAALTMTVCSGARLPALWGWLEDRPFCTHHEVYDAVQKISPAAVPKPDLRYVKSNDQLWTSGGISAGIDLSFRLLSLLHGTDVVNKTAKYMEYRLEDLDQ